MIKKRWLLVRYALLFFCVVVADQITKLWAIVSLNDAIISVCNSVNLHLMWNRGVAWSLLSSESTTGFIILSVFIVCMIAGFAFFSFIRYHNNYSIFFETLVLAGAVSNVIDRCLHGAVVDFIECFYQSWYFPTFNIADAAIFIGVLGMLFFTQHRDQYGRR